VTQKLLLPRSTQIGYATADVGLNTVETALRLYLLIFYTDEVGLRPGLAGLAVALGLVWDAVTDPIMGVISDRTVHRFGGRRGYLLPGAVVSAVGLLVVFWPPPLTGQAAMFVWLLGSFCLLNTGMTVISVPLMAMAGEITADPHLRAVLFGWRFAACNVGAVSAAALPELFRADPGRGSVQSMVEVSAIAAVLVVATAFGSWRATARVRFEVPPPHDVTLWGAFRAPLANAPFRPLLGAYVVATLGIGVNSAAALYYYRYRLDLDEAQIHTLLVVFMVVFTASILGWVKLAKRFGKRRLMAFGGVALGVANGVLYLVLPPGEPLPAMVFGGVGLGVLVGCVVLIDAMLTDVLDHDLLRTGQVRSGLFFGVWRFASKLARAGSICLAGLVLEVVGFVPNQDQTALVEWSLAVLFGPVVGLCFFGAGWILHLYRFDERQQARVRRLLARRPRRGLG
jgi:GPH family glycoside/pentoside/hexuronide:cation symporter